MPALTGKAGAAQGNSHASVVAACEGEASCAMVVCYQPHQAPSHIRAVEPLNIRFFS